MKYKLIERRNPLNPGVPKKWYANPTFENPLCLPCKYLPICNGPCPQKMMELNGGDFSNICIKNMREQSFEDAIIDLYEFRMRDRRQNA